MQLVSLDNATRRRTRFALSVFRSCRLIETDAKSLNSLSCQNGHSRRSSETSQISITSGGSSFQENTEEDMWGLWGKIINEWESWSKKKQPQVKVS